MIVGSISENKNIEKRVAITPDGVQELVSQGLEVRVQTEAGKGVGIEDQAFAILQWAEHALHGMYMLSNTILQAVDKGTIAKDATIAEQTIAFENVCGVRDDITFTAVEFAHVKTLHLSEEKTHAFLPSFYQFLQEKWQAEIPFLLLVHVLFHSYPYNRSLP